MTLNHQGEVLHRNSDWEDEESDNNLYPTIDLERELTIRDVFNVAFSAIPPLLISGSTMLI